MNKNLKQASILKSAKEYYKLDKDAHSLKDKKDVIRKKLIRYFNDNVSKNKKSMVIDRLKITKKTTKSINIDVLDSRLSKLIKDIQKKGLSKYLVIKVRSSKNEELSNLLKNINSETESKVSFSITAIHEDK